MPTIAEAVGSRCCGIAGQRINPRTNGPHRAQVFAVALAQVDRRRRGAEGDPAGASRVWRGLAFRPMASASPSRRPRDNGIELWIGDTATGQAKAVTPAQLNASLDTPCEWVGDGASLLCAVRRRRAAARRRRRRPCPRARTSRSTAARSRRFAPIEDLLTSLHDEALFDYYATQPAGLRGRGDRPAHAGRQARGLRESPAHRPTATTSLVSRACTSRTRGSCPTPTSRRTVEIWDRKGAAVKQIAELPVADTVPNGGVLPGPRSYQWQPLAPATLVWAEALDNGDPKTTVPHRDKVMTTRGAVQRPADRARAKTDIATATSRGPTPASRC